MHRGAVVYTFVREQFAATLANADLLAAVCDLADRAEPPRAR